MNTKHSMSAEFARNLDRYSNLRQRIHRSVEKIVRALYANTERLGQVAGGLDLRGLPKCSGGQEFSRDFRNL